MKKNIVLLLSIGVISLFNTVYAQSTGDSSKTSAKPLELPNFVIEKVEQLSINIGAKQKAQPPLPLEADYLDSVNSFEKQKIVPLKTLTNSPKPMDLSYKNAFLKGSIGMNTTAFVHGGYGIDFEGYDIYGDAKFDMSSGHENDAEYQKFDLKLTSDYIAPEKYFIFGGSRTRTSVNFQSNSFNLYARSKDEDFVKNSGLYERDFLNFDAKVSSTGNFNGVKFNTGASFNTFHLESKNSKGFQNGVSGFVKLHNYWKKFLLAGNLFMDLQNVRGNTNNYIEADLSGKFFTKKISLNVTGGLQYALSTLDKNRGGLKIKGDIEYRLNNKLTLNAQVQSGLRRNSYSGLYNINPYMNISGDVDFAYDVINVGGGIFYHPTNDIAISANLTYKNTQRQQYFYSNEESKGIFEVGYLDANCIGLDLELWYNITDKDNLLADMKIDYAGIEKSKILPYTPLAKINTTYSRVLLDGLTGKIGIVFASSRYADIENEVELDSYLNLRLGFNYDITNDLSVNVGVDNLLNSNVYIWDGYKEKGLFANLGMIWRFN